MSPIWSRRSKPERSVYETVARGECPGRWPRALRVQRDAARRQRALLQSESDEPGGLRQHDVPDDQPMRPLLGLLAVLALVGCASSDKDKPRPMLMTPQSRLIYHDGTHGLWTTCDRGNRVYLSHEG